MDLVVLQNCVGQVAGQAGTVALDSRLLGLVEPDEPGIDGEELVGEVEDAYFLVLVEVPGDADIAVVFLEGLLDVGPLVRQGLLDPNHTREPPEQRFAKLTSTHMYRLLAVIPSVRPVVLVVISNVEAHH